MKFEHLIEINDISDSTHAPLTREDLWFGLLCRAEDARAFLPGLDSCEIIERNNDFIFRELRFGSKTIRDRVSFCEMEWICFESEKNSEHSGGKLTISIEEPHPGALFLRFQYLTTLPENADGEDARYADFVRSAYHQSDIDTLKVIRMISESKKPQ